MRCLVLSLILLSFLSVGRADELPQRFIEFLPRKEIDLSTLALNAFSNQSVFGSPSQQFKEIRKTLRITRVRLLFAWTEAVQPSPSSSISHGFNNDLIRSLPRGMKAIVVLANMPGWMADRKNWIGGDPVRTYYRRWIKPVVRRFRRKRKIEGFQIFNEPDSSSFLASQVLGTDVSPQRYIDLLKRAHRFISRRTKKKVIGAATTSIFQNFPETLEYNQSLRDLGIQRYLDVYAIHIYGTSMERYYLGIDAFLHSLSTALWVTESGKQGADEQLNYVERVWPFMAEEVPAIERFYYYRYAEDGGSSSTFGLKNTSSTMPLSDLYIHVRGRRNQQ